MKSVATALSLMLTAMPALAQPAIDAKSGPLFDTIAAQDKQLFDAYNNCDLKTLSEIVSDDLEFYHDRTGLSRGRAAFIDAIKTKICGKVRRELIPGTLEAHPLNTYGAVEIGDHVFCPAATKSACNPKAGGAAKFTMLWQQTPAGWKLTRVISYDHF
jgi:hypothetical protein